MIAVGCGAGPDAQTAVDALVRDLDTASPSLVLAFCADSYDVGAVARGLVEQMPGALVAGCTTMGEICPDGFTDDALVGIALPGARAVGEWIPDVRRHRLADGMAVVGRLAARFERAPEELDPTRHLLLLFTDGLSGVEELCATSIAAAAPGLPLVGACAADRLRFDRAQVFLGAEARAGAGVAVLVEPRVPFRTFSLRHHVATGERVVVTQADPEHRRVLRLDGMPALARFAQLCGDRLDPAQVAACPVQFALRSQDAAFVRSVMAIEGDSLRMGGPVEEGQILEVMEGADLVASTREGLAAAARSLARPERALLFECGGRLLESRQRGLEQGLQQALQSAVPAVGFHSFGEHHGPLLHNHTLTGVVFGASEPLDVE